MKLYCPVQGKQMHLSIVFVKYKLKFRITNINPKHPLIGENVSMTCSIEVIPDMYKSGIEIIWSGPTEQFEEDSASGRINCDDDNMVKRIDDDSGRTKSYVISR